MVMASAAHADDAAAPANAPLSIAPADASPAAQVWTSRPDYAPGEIVSIHGSGFAAGESVDLQVVHADGVPNTDASHTPWTVAADASGAISSSWTVDTVDAVGSTLALTAAGETSQQTAQTTFKDAGHPFWIFGHNPNSEFDASAYLALGANALEPDIEFIPGDGLVVRHDTTIFSSSHPLIPYLQHLADLAGNYNLALIVFDVKSEAASHPGAALELANDIQTYLLTPHPEVRVILSTASTGDADAFFPPLAGTDYVKTMAFQIDGENNPKSEVDHLHQVLGADAKIGYGDGTAGCCGRAFPLGPFLGPNTPTSLEQGVWVRTSFGTLNMVSYGFAVTGTDTMKMLIDSGVDGLIPSDFVIPGIPGGPFPLDTLDALALVNSHYGGTYMATSADDPFSVKGARNGAETGSRQGYALEVQTANSSGAGTDANITFTLHGELGDASVTMDSSWANKMETGDKNYVFIRSGDLGHLKSVTVEQDGTGGLWGNLLGLGSKWDLSYIKVRSYAYIDTDGVYPTPGDPNQSRYEYNADFGGQTIDDNTPVSVDLKSGIPFLATLTNGDLVLNMGPNAAARVGGDISDGNESFTVHHVSTQPDGSETVTVSAFGMRPQTYVGVKQIHGDGGAGSDSLTVDGAFTIPIFFNGGGDPGDQLILQNATFDTVTHNFTNAHDGTVALDPDGPGPASATLITYTGLAPITDSLVAANRTFNFTGGAETITMSDDPGAAAGMSRIDSTLSESVDFANPTSTLTVNASAGIGPDVVNIQALDPAFNANTTVNASSGGDHITVATTTGTTNAWTINGASGGDVFDIQGTGVTTSVIGASTSTVNVGAAGSVQAVTGTLNIENPASPNTLTVDDSSDSTGRSAVFSGFVNADDSQGNSDPWGRIHGLAPADINYEYADTSSLAVTTGGGADKLGVQATGVPTTLATGGGADIVSVTSDAPANAGNLDDIQAPLTLDAGSGANRLIVSNFGGSPDPNIVVTNNQITGMAPVPITYAATGGNFTDGAANDGVLLRGSDNGADTFLALSTLAGSTTKIEGNAGADTFLVGSTPADNNGNLDGIAGLLTVIGGNPGAPLTAFPNTVDPTGQVDVLYVNDRGAGGKRNYRVGDFTSDGVDNPMVQDNHDSSAPARVFAGVAYDSTMDYVRVDGTDDVNIFDVRPSLTTQYYIDGNLPPPGQCLKGGGDYLRLDTTGTTGRKLHITSPGAGFWSFTSGHRPVDFERIERFNHVDIFATAPDAGTSSAAVVKVYDAETAELLTTVAPFGNSFKGGVRVATGDLNCDGLPDVIVAPGPGNDPAVKIYDGAPDANGNQPAPLLTSFSVFPTTFKGGVNLAVGDVNGDGHNDLVVASDTGGPPQLKVLDGQYVLTTHALLGSPFNAFPATFLGGVSVAVGDINNDGYADIVTVSGAGMATTLKVFDGNGYGLVKSFTPFGPGVAGSTASVAVGDFNGDGRRDIIVGTGTGSTGTVNVFGGTTNFAVWPMSIVASFQPYGSAFQGGIRLTAKPADGGNPGSVEKVNVLTAPGPGAGQMPRFIRQASYAGAGVPPTVVNKLLEDPNYNGVFIG